MVHQARTALLEEPELDSWPTLRQFPDLLGQSLSPFVTNGEPGHLQVRPLAPHYVSHRKPERLNANEILRQRSVSKSPGRAASRRPLVASMTAP
jgi:hypothetical protein